MCGVADRLDLPGRLLLSTPNTRNQNMACSIYFLCLEGQSNEISAYLTHKNGLNKRYLLGHEITDEIGLIVDDLRTGLGP